VDEDELLSASTFPLPPAVLVDKCKQVLLANFGADKPELLAENFAFIGEPRPRARGLCLD
jgi:hypothetical protein